MEHDKSTLGWNDDDVNFDIGLEKWGVDVDDLQKKTIPERTFNAWIEDWENAILKHNDTVSEARLLEKYKGLCFYDIDQDITYTAYSHCLEYKKFRNGGWCLIGAPPDYDGSADNDHLLYPYLINDNLVEMIAETKQPDHLNVIVIDRQEDDDEDLSEVVAV